MLREVSRGAANGPVLDDDEVSGSTATASADALLGVVRKRGGSPTPAARPASAAAP